MAPDDRSPFVISLPAPGPIGTTFVADAVKGALGVNRLDGVNAHEPENVPVRRCAPDRLNGSEGTKEWDAEKTREAVNAIDGVNALEGENSEDEEKIPDAVNVLEAAKKVEATNFSESVKRRLWPIGKDGWRRVVTAKRDDWSNFLDGTCITVPTIAIERA
jgi:hypothetical protein